MNVRGVLFKVEGRGCLDYPLCKTPIITLSSLTHTIGVSVIQDLLRRPDLPPTFCIFNRVP